jgi:hypothetical protein
MTDGTPELFRDAEQKGGNRGLVVFGDPAKMIVGRIRSKTAALIPVRTLTQRSFRSMAIET